MANVNLTASEQFAKNWTRAARRDRTLGRELARRANAFYKKKNVVGFGIGTKMNRECVIFFVTRKEARYKLNPKDRLPRWIAVGKRRVITDVIGVGKSRLTVSIGDASDNQKSYHAAGTGSWKMGTEIRCFTQCQASPARDPQPVSVGTSGALVKSAASPSDPPLMLSCGHVLLKPAVDVAQAKEDRVPPCQGAANLKNFIGGVKDLAQIATADAGIVECADGLSEIILIGKYKLPQEPLEGLNVQKSGRTTGLTHSKITIKECERKLTLPPPLNKLFGVDEVIYKGLFAVDVVCKDSPALPANQTLKPKEAVDKFSWEGDSGSLIVAGGGEAHHWGDKDLDDTYEKADAAGKKTIDDKWQNAALGLQVLQDDKYSYGQRISLALKALSVELYTG
jgi:hypothetical protein